MSGFLFTPKCPDLCSLIIDPRSGSLKRVFLHFPDTGPAAETLLGKKHLHTYMHDSQTLQKLPKKKEEEERISIFGPLQQSVPYNFETSGYKRQLFI